jgi:integrase
VRAVVKEQAMSVKVRRYRRGGWEVDMTVLLPDGTRHRERRRVSVTSKSAASRWGELRERELMMTGPAKAAQEEVPTFGEFASRFIEGYARANRQKPSGIAGKQTILKVHLVPALGATRLDAITNEDVQRLKHIMRVKAPKTVNNVLTVLNTLLKTAVEWGVITRVPCTIRLLRTPKSTAQFHDFEAFDRLASVAEDLDPQTYLAVLLGGSAGLRCGEMMALEWRDVDLEKRQLSIERSEWKGHVTSTKGGRVRYVPMTRRLAAALRAHRHLRGRRVLCQHNGEPLTQKMVQVQVRRAAGIAKVSPTGVHVLRHTFCSHLAMRGAPARAIQELAGHQDLSTTQRYMHLSPAALDGAIRLLDQGNPAPGFGDILETEGAGR